MNKLVTFCTNGTEVIEFGKTIPQALTHTNLYPFCVLLGKTKVKNGKRYVAIRIFRSSDRLTKDYWVEQNDIFEVTDDWVSRIHASFYPLSKWLDYKHNPNSKYHCR